PAEFQRGLDEDFIRFGEAAQLAVLRQRQRDAAGLPSGAGGEPVELGPAETSQPRQCFPLAYLVRREFDCNGRDGRGWCAVGVPPLYARGNRAPLSLYSSCQAP